MDSRQHSKYMGTMGRNLRGIIWKVCVCLYWKKRPKCDGADSEKVPHNEHSARKHIASEFLAADSSALLG